MSGEIGVRVDQFAAADTFANRPFDQQRKPTPLALQDCIIRREHPRTQEPEEMRKTRGETDEPIDDQAQLVPRAEWRLEKIGFDRLDELGEPLADKREEEVGLAGEIDVERSLADMGRRGHVIEEHLVKGLRREEPGRGSHDLAALSWIGALHGRRGLRRAWQRSIERLICEAYTRPAKPTRQYSSEPPAPDSAPVLPLMNSPSASRVFKAPVTVVSLIMLLLASCAAGLAGCAESGPEASARGEPEPVAVTLADVQRRTVPRLVEVTGTLFAAEDATISAEVSGRVESIACDVGDEVPQGSLLAQLETTQYALALDQKRAALLETLATLGLSELPPAEFDPEKVPSVVKARREAENAEARYARAERLWNQDPPLISEQDFSDLRTARDVSNSDTEVALLTARAALAAARSRAVEIELAAQRLEDATVLAPVFETATGGSGVRVEGGIAPAVTATGSPRRYSVASRMISVGEYVAAGTPMFRVIASDPIKFRGDVPERFVDQIKPGQSAILRVESSSDEFTGRVARVNPQINMASRTFQVEIEVPNEASRLRAGAFGRATIAVGEDTEVQFVPERALVVFAGVTKVFSVGEGKAIEHRVEPGRRWEGHIEVLGLAPSVDRVVASGGSRLATGTPVAVGDGGVQADAKDETLRDARTTPGAGQRRP